HAACGRDARVDELAHTARDRPRLGAPPVDARVGIARLVGDEQLDRMTEDRIGELSRSRERLVLVPEVRAEELVDRCENLRPGAVVERQRQELLRLLAPRPENTDVGMSKAVDRLELVADE